jgi:integrase
MRQPIKLVVRKGKIRQDGTSLIFLQYCHTAARRVLIGTGVAIPPEYWDKRSGRISRELPPQYGKVEELENYLTDKARKAEDMVRQAKLRRNVCPMQFLKINFPLSDKWRIEQMKDNRSELDVFRQIDAYIKEKKDTVRPCTINVIETMKVHLKSFEEYRKIPITFDSFDFHFYEELLHYLTYDIVLLRKKTLIRGLKVNSLAKTIKYLKSFLKNRMARKIIPFLDLSLYKVPDEEVDSIYLNWKEIASLYKLALSHDLKMEAVRDLFVLGCLTGLRFSDYTVLRPEEIRDGMLFVTQVKTSGRVIVPVRPEAAKILEKYALKMPQVTNPEFNFYIKEIAKLAGLNEIIKIAHKRGNKMVEEIRPKHAWVVSHTCRRSFCTNEFLDGTPVHLIMAISGHKTEKAFRRYIKADVLQKAQMIKAIWDKRPGL